jgi:drug/metabolite transporter (DMT)-like permease
LSASPSATSSPGTGRPKRYVLALALGVMLFIWSLNFIVGKITLRHIDALSLAALRIELAALLILPFFFLRPQGSRVTLRARDLWIFAYLGFFGVVINQGLFTIGLSYTTSGHSSMVVAVGPIIVLMMARAMKLEALTLSKILGMVISVGGVVVLATEQGLDFRSPILAGDLITLCGTVGYCVYAVFGKRVANNYDTISMNTFNMVAAAIFMLPLAVRQGARLDWTSVGWVGWAGMFYMAAFSSVVAYLLFYWTLRYMTASRVAVVSYFEPVAVVILAAVFLGEHPTRHLLAGGALVLLGVYLAERGTS